MKTREGLKLSHQQVRNLAFQQVLKGKLGCLAGNPSTAYIEALREFTYRWLGEIEEALAQSYARDALAAELAAMNAHDNAVENGTSCGCDCCEQTGGVTDPNH